MDCRFYIYINTFKYTLPMVDFINARKLEAEGGRSDTHQYGRWR
ncbi:hypothetical protein AGR4B_Cc50077 [Agrobacterium tumefaciens str. CFBP 5621]|nr:hypothetical protein AGR4B_Cc50077 [Agrobacterium tumefaciens str. CFBP 5621]